MSARPAVVVLATTDAPYELIAALCAGCEEEGVPVRVEPGDAAARTLACLAAEQSELAIGIGVAGRTVVIHERNLSHRSPGLEAIDAGESTSRLLGANAARIVKGRPLRGPPNVV